MLHLKGEKVGEEPSRPREMARFGRGVGSVWGGQRSQVESGLEESSSWARGAQAPARGRLPCLGGWGLPGVVSEMLAAVSALSPSAPSRFRASTSFLGTDRRGISEEAATYFSSEPWTPHPQLPLGLGLFGGTKSWSESRPKALGVKTSHRTGSRCQSWETWVPAQL